MTEDNLDQRSAAERRQTGRERFREVMGTTPPATDTAFHAHVVDVAFGSIWDRPGLTRKERRLISLAAVGATGAPFAIQSHVRAALASGDCTYDEMKELALHLVIYLGMPKAATVDRAIDGAWDELQGSGS